MHTDLTAPSGGVSPRSERTQAIHRRRIAGTALLGLGIVGWWLGRLWEIW